MKMPIAAGRLRALILLNAINVIDRNRKPRLKPRRRTAFNMSSIPLSPAEPDRSHIAIMIITIPKGTVTIGETPRLWNTKADKKSENTKGKLLASRRIPVSVGVKARTEIAKLGIK